MAWIKVPKGWELPEREATSEYVYLNRRKFMASVGRGAVGAVGLLAGCGYQRIFEPLSPLPGPAAPPQEEPPQHPVDEGPPPPLYPATLNPAFSELDRALTEEAVAAAYNNSYEFSAGKVDILKLAADLTTEPWKVEVGGEVEKPKTYDMDDLLRRMPLEERLYRHRCVEAWAMAVPWTGFPMKKLVGDVVPRSSVKYVTMLTFLNPGEAPGQFNRPDWPWPYMEALSVEEAANDMTMLVTGIYGHELPKQHGAPLRLITPWKYGFKSIKSIVRITFTRNRPKTFWTTLVPREYDFLANVNPSVPHPRWSQAEERMIGTDEKRPTLLYNGYGEYVANLYT